MASKFLRTGVFGSLRRWRTASVFFAVGGVLSACAETEGSSGTDPAADASPGGGVNAGGSAGQMNNGGGGVNAGGSAASDAAVTDASSSDASAPPMVDSGALDASEGSPDASSSDGGREASTCNNAVEDPEEQCCTAADQDAFVDEVATAFVAGFPTTFCLPLSQMGSLTGTFATGAQWCYLNSGVGCNPGCILPTTWTNATATSDGGSHTLLATVTLLPFFAPIRGQLLGASLGSCTIQISESGDLSATFDVVDHGTYVGGALTNGEALDLTVGLQDCGFTSDLPDLEAAFNESIRDAVLEVVHLTFATLRHECAY